jgi:hypothetical protein
MATATKNKAHHGTLTASAVDTVTLSRPTGQVKVINRLGTSEIFYTLDGTAPTVNGDCYVVVATAGAYDIRPNRINNQNAQVVNLISAGAMTYSVENA